MSIDFYLDVCRQLSRLLTTRYSTSFSLGIKVFPPDIQKAIYSIYGFVRVADEIVDTFPQEDKSLWLRRFKDETALSITEGISTNPVLESFQDVVRRYKIDHEYIDAFLYSMEMDLTQKTFDRPSFERYIYGSAEVVGLMCLKVFCHQEEALFQELVAPARQLGSAFQKVNFLRDIKEDCEIRGRIYLPGISCREAIDEKCKHSLEQEIAEEFAAALPGIMKLPRPARLAVYSVYLYYQSLFKTLQRQSISTILCRRVRISNLYKMVLLIRAILTVTFSPR